MWKEFDLKPNRTGNYLVQFPDGEVTIMSYTVKGGWNTHYQSDGTLYLDSAMEKPYIVRWKEIEEPEISPDLRFRFMRWYWEGSE